MIIIQELISMFAAANIQGQLPVTEGFNELFDLVDIFFNHNNVHHLEGRTGVEAFEKLCRVLGYSNLDAFLEDNSGAIESMVEFVKSQNNEDWQMDLAKWLQDEGADFENIEESAKRKPAVTQLDEKVFDEGKYTWYAWTQSKPSKAFERRGGSKQLTKGMQFGLRPATSKSGTWRLIMKANGPSIIFSIPEEEAKALAKQALELI